MPPKLVKDTTLHFPAYLVCSTRKTEQRQFVASHATDWLALRKASGAKGAVMVDIDDTLIDGNESVGNGFQYMKSLYEKASKLFPVHVVTARPDDEHARVMQLLSTRGFSIPPDRLHMLPAALYGEDESHVVRFKWDAYQRIRHEHGGVVARIGDKLWDVAHIESMHADTGSLRHVRDEDCIVFSDPRQKGTVSYKLPGRG
jgi:hypothetical protein